MSTRSSRPPRSSKTSARLRPPRKPKAIRRTVFAHERIASEAARRLGQLGIPLDFSPASLAGIDCYLGVLLPAGEHPDVSSPELDDQLLLFGSYVGETFRKRLGGDWHDPGTGDDLPSRIQLLLPNDEPFYPLRPVHQSLLRVPPTGLRCLDAFEQLRNRLDRGADSPHEAPQWVTFAGVLLGAGQLREAHRLLRHATALDPTLTAAWLSRAQAEEQLGTLEEATESLREAQRLLPPGDATLGEIQFRISALLTRLGPGSLPPVALSPEETSTELELIPELGTSPPPAPLSFPGSGGSLNGESSPPWPPSPWRAAGGGAGGEAPAAVEETATTTTTATETSATNEDEHEHEHEQDDEDERLRALLPGSEKGARMQAPSIRALASTSRRSMAPSIFPQAEEDGSLADNLIELARTGQIEFVDVLLDETRADWELVEPDVLAWLSRLESQGTADEKRNACGVAMMLADRKGFRPNALPEEAEDSLRILEKASLALGASLPPLPRARLTLALAAAYSDRAAGDRERNQKEALQLVESALFLIDARTHPELLGRAHKLLGTIHRKRGAGSRRDHSEAAIGAFRAALRVFSPTGQPELWASVQLDLGNTLRQRHAGDRNENNEQAIEAFTAGLRVLSREQSPLDWGLLKLALGQALLERDVADRTATLERAISTLHEAEEALPASAPEYATTQYRLGLAYQRRKTGDRLDNLQRAAEHYARSLPGLSPEERRSAEENLDAARQELRRKQR